MSVITASDLIRGAMKQLRVIGQGETATNEEMQDGLDTLNLMLDSWSLDRLYVFCEKQDILTMQAAKNAYTWGTGGDINTTRPIKLTSVYTLDGAGVSYPAHILKTAAEYDQIAVKGVPAYWPTHVFLDPTYPLATLRLWPTPSVTYSLYLRSYQQLQQFATLTDSISLPPGYMEAILFNLAMSMAGSFGLEPSSTVATKATVSAGRLKRSNIQFGKAVIESAGMNSGRSTFNVLAGE